MVIIPTWHRGMKYNYVNFSFVATAQISFLNCSFAFAKCYKEPNLCELHDKKVKASLTMQF